MTHSRSSIFNRHLQQLRQELVVALAASGVLYSPSLQQAFLTIPREEFVPCFYEDDKANPNMKWRCVNAHETPSEAYLAKVYRDQSLVTKIDERGRPISSRAFQFTRKVLK